MTELEDALDTLKERLGQEGHAAEIVIDTAREYELNPILLRRKFEERFSVSPEAYVPTISITTLNRRRARKEAQNWAWQLHSQIQTISMAMDAFQKHQQRKGEWIEHQVRDHHLGVIFAESGYEYAFAGLSSSGAIMAIPVDGGDPVERSAQLYQIVFKDDAKPFAWTSMQEVRPHISGVIWRIGNPHLEFSNEQEAYAWLREHTVVGAIENLA